MQIISQLYQWFFGPRLPVEKDAEWILTNKAHGSGPKVAIRIGQIGQIGNPYHDESLRKIFTIINQKTLGPYYPNGSSRSCHDGTHSARQARMVEVLFDLIVKGPLKNIVEELSDKEKFHLMLAAYLLRSGRIDESTHLDANPDDYNTRSALIYEAYAKQLVASEETLPWVKNLIVNSCKPLWQRDPNIDKNPKWKLGWTCLTVAHDLDLVRCYGRLEIETRIISRVNSLLSPYIHPCDVGNIAKRLLDYSGELNKATGQSNYYESVLGNYQLAQSCGQDGEKCWAAVKTVPFKG